METKLWAFDLYFFIFLYLNIFHLFEYLYE